MVTSWPPFILSFYLCSSVCRLAVTHGINLDNSNFHKNTQSVRMFRTPELHNVNYLLTPWCRSRRVDTMELTKIKRLLDTNSTALTVSSASSAAVLNSRPKVCQLARTLRMAVFITEVGTIDI